MKDLGDAMKEANWNPRIDYSHNVEPPCDVEYVSVGHTGMHPITAKHISETIAPTMTGGGNELAKAIEAILNEELKDWGCRSLVVNRVMPRIRRRLGI